jgi:predicted metalloprotease with PDZ domain
MNSKLFLAILLVPVGALGQESSSVAAEALAPAPVNVFYQRLAIDQPPPADAPSPPHKGQDPNLEAQLDAARARLEQAAREVAELSSQLGGPIVQRFSTFHGPFGRAIIGVQLDSAGGKDGAHVQGVSPGGPAAEAGMRPGDVIIAVNGTDVKGEDAARQVVKVIESVKPESKVAIRVLRDGKPRDFTVAARPEPGFRGFDGGFPNMPNMPQIPPMRPFFMMQGPMANMELATLTPQLGKYFGTDKGVLVVRAPPEGALKLEDGDVILSIDGREPTSGSHATRILGSYQPGEKITLRIIRQHKNMDLEMTVPDGPPHGLRREIPAPGGEPMTAPMPGKPIRHRENETI